MRLKGFAKTRKAAATVAVVALVAAVSYAVSDEITPHAPAFALSAGESFSITSQVYASTCTGAAGAKLVPNVSRCLAITVTNPLSVALDVTSLSIVKVSFTPTSTNDHTPACTATTLTAPKTFTEFTVTAGTTHTVDEQIELLAKDATQDNCLNGTFHFTYSATATYTDTTTTGLSAELTGTTGILSAIVIPANPAFDPHGPAGAPVHHVTFYSCGTTPSCLLPVVLATTTLTPEGTPTQIADATYEVTGLTSAGTYYFEASYPATALKAGTFAGSTSPIRSITVSSSGVGGSGSGSGGAGATPTPLPPPGLAPGITVVGGKTADTTAALELTRVFPYAKRDCPTSRAAVVATTKVFQDALSSQYLAQELTTGTLLTPTETLSPITAAMLKDEGIQTVYIVGGPLAVDTAVAQEIADLTAYECGGTTRTPTTGKIVVHRIWGKTQYGTAKAVAEFVGPGSSLSFAGAYATTNATGGTGKFNDTGGKGTSAPGGAEPTAILASGEEFQDAQAASVISYRTKVPLLLTAATSLVTTAIGAIKKLGVTQVILMGGTMAVTNAVEATLVAKTGVSVLRIAGKDYTDTAAELARFEAAGTTEGLGWTPDHRVLIARGNGFTDGIAGAVIENVHNTATGIAGAGRPLLLTESPTVLGTYLTTFLKVTGHTGIDKIKGKTVTDLTIFGGPLAVSTTELVAMQTDLAH